MKSVEALALVAACVAAIGAGAGVALHSGAPVTPAATDTALVERPARPAPSHEPNFLFSLPASRDAWGAKGRRDVDALRDDFLRSSRLDDLFERGLRHPDAGGLFYARQALRHCGMLRNAGGSASVGRDAAVLERARDRCGALGDPASRERLNATLQTASARLDPALSIVNTIDDRSREARLTPADVRDAIDASIALGDPYVLRYVFLRGIPRIERFDGRPVDVELRGDLMMASRLALCDLGVDCAQEARVLLTCANKDGCSDPFSAMGIGGDSLSIERRRRLGELADRVRTAARDGSLPQLLQ